MDVPIDTYEKEVLPNICFNLEAPYKQATWVLF